MTVVFELDICVDKTFFYSLLVINLIIRILLLTSAFFIMARPYCVFGLKLRFLRVLTQARWQDVRLVRLNASFCSKNKEGSSAVFEAEMRILTKSELESAHYKELLGPSWVE